MPDQGDGRLHTGELERIAWRQWTPDTPAPSSPLVEVVRSLAALPASIKQALADGLYGIWIGPGSVCDLDAMGHLRGLALPSGRGRWEDCGGAYVSKSILLGDRPTPTPDVALHEVGHALDDLHGPPRGLISDQPLWRAIYETCLPYLTEDLHRAPAPLGSCEFFADSLAACAKPATVELSDWLGGDRVLINLVASFHRATFGIGRR
ncbi:hypothetical protein GCM10010411_76230 [Actinomadura fulvescens]|uniref:Uncharacterized protein n=1 Tax=Actinomadura fulvescens TaxID=46160 RepID=A0ABN3QJ36_9ACTN